jgi:glycosyltransferase involved in cell wall biosynthesis
VKRSRDPKPRPQITVCIPTVDGREELRDRAIRSAQDQTWPAARILIQRDADLEGAAAARNQLIARTGTEWIAWLDDDDWFGSRHLETMARAVQADPSLDLVYTSPQMEPLAVRDGVPSRPVCPAATTYQGVFPREPWGLRWCPEFESHIRRRGSFVPITHLVRTEAVVAAGGFPPGRVLPDGRYQGEDERYLIALLDRGAVFHHVDRTTWHWYANPRSTAGKGAAGHG